MEGKTTKSKTTTPAPLISSLLHEATPVMLGKRFVFLPFLYDDVAARLRKANVRFVSSEENTPEQAQQAAGMSSDVRPESAVMSRCRQGRELSKPSDSLNLRTTLPNRFEYVHLIGLLNCTLRGKKQTKRGH